MFVSEMGSKYGRTVILGIGNLLLRDEGIGVHVAQTLQRILPKDGEFEVIDGATSPDIFLLLQEVGKLVVVDAIEADEEPGAIYRFQPKDIENEDKVGISAHQTSMVGSLKLMQQLKQGPKDVIIIGVQPKDKSCGLGLSAELKRRVPEIIGIVMKEAGLKGGNR